EVQLRLLFRNDGKQTLILLKPELLDNATRKVEYLYRSLGNDSRPPDETERVVATKIIPSAVEAAYSRNAIMYDGYKDYKDAFCNRLGGIAAALDKNLPPFQQTITLEPGTSREFLDKITIEQSFKLGESGPPTKRWEAFSAGDAYEPSIPVS